MAGAGGPGAVPGDDVTQRVEPAAGLALLAGLRHRVGDVAEGVGVEEIPALVAPER